MPTLEEVKDYLGIDYADPMTDRRLGNLVKVADAYLVGALGIGYPKDDSRAHELALIVIADLHDNHDMSDRVSGNVRKLIHDFQLQLKCDMRRVAYVSSDNNAEMERRTGML